MNRLVFVTRIRNIMPISSYIIRCAPADQPGVLRALRAVPGAEAGEPNETGIPVVTDTSTIRAAVELGERLQQLPGVRAAVLVYHNFEDVADDSATPAADFKITQPGGAGTKTVSQEDAEAAGKLPGPSLFPLRPPVKTNPQSCASCAGFHR